MTREEYNSTWLDGLVDQDYLVVRTYNGVTIVNLECSRKGCRSMHVQVYSNITHNNTYSLFQDSVCSICLASTPIRVTTRIPVGIMVIDDRS